jgi:hypothetical protein
VGTDWRAALVTGTGCAAAILCLPHLGTLSDAALIGLALVGFLLLLVGSLNAGWPDALAAVAVVLLSRRVCLQLIQPGLPEALQAISPYRVETAGSVFLRVTRWCCTRGWGVELRNGDYFGPLLNRVARRLEARHGGQSTTSERGREERDVARARSGLGVTAFASAWAEGRRMPLDQAVAYALEPVAEA